MSLPRLIVCDDEPAARRGAARALGARYDVGECGDGAALLEELARRPADLVLLDLRMPGMDGRTALDRIVALPSPPAVVVVTADSSLRSAIDAVKAGAADYLAKPYEIEELRHVVEKALEARDLRRENVRLKDEVRRLGGPGLAGESAVFREALEMLDRVAPSGVSVLVTGETGTGKELAARRIHERSLVAKGPFVAVNGAAIPETLVESELFGHRRGAFTGADRDRIGRIQEADGGTLFLDEVGELPLAAQAKLLRVLEDGLVSPLGGGRPVAVTVRVVAATHRDLKALVADGKFREDLLFRLRVVDVALPPLRERGDDVLLLARLFLAATGRPLTLSAEAEPVLRAHRWPGNVRELRNAMERAAVFCRSGAVHIEDLPPDVRAAAGQAGAALPTAATWTSGTPFAAAKEQAVEAWERATLVTALRANGGNVSRTARALGLHRPNLQQKLKELGIDAEAFR